MVYTGFLSGSPIFLFSLLHTLEFVAPFLLKLKTIRSSSATCRLCLFLLDAIFDRIEKLSYVVIDVEFDSIRSPRDSDSLKTLGFFIHFSFLIKSVTENQYPIL